ncbi:unnamed protein product [Spirodela intermedia]|uniref:Uncharacterized protein n=1 Tax=Spirodela intermedia TaxID=51605 RepID=A0A7I8IM17_SPIIN|nr:unnamed protein product [Spirodela intermedia]CAA6659015.1 unnamed protein product [Spirodela intermedia]
MATAGSSGAAAAEVVDGPVLSMMNKRLRALRKKYNRILQMEESVAQGKTLNKEQEEVFRSKPAIATLIEEYERLRQPLSAAVQEELALARASLVPPSAPPPLPSVEDDKQDRDQGETAVEAAEGTGTPQEPRRDREAAVEDLLNLLYFGCLFDVKSQSEFASMVFTRTHERESCLTYDYVTDDSTGFLLEGDLDLLSKLASLVISRPVHSGDSHKSALLGCVHRAKLWLGNSDQPIHPESSITYAGLRERLNRILSSDYFTKAPEMKAPADVAVAVGKSPPSSAVADAPPAHYQEKEETPESFESSDSGYDQSGPVDHSPKNESGSLNATGDANAVHPERYQNQRDADLNELQYGHRRPYQNQRGGGGRAARGGGGGYQNGRSQYYDSGYYPRNYYNPRGRGGSRGGGGPAMYSHVAPEDVELQAST